MSPRGAWRVPTGALRWALLVAVLALPRAAAAQVTVTTDPSFPSGAPVTLHLTGTSMASPAWCTPEASCVPVQAHTWVSVWTLDGFSSGVANLEGPWVVGDVVDPTPRTAPVTYYAGGVVLWDLCMADCFWYYVTYGEIVGTLAYGEDLGSASVSTAPIVTPVAVGVTPASGVGATQTFTFQYASAAGYADIAEAWALIHDTLTGWNSCVITYTPSSNLIWLWTDSGTGSEWTNAPMGSGTVLENSQCRVFTGTASTSGSGTTRSVSIPIAFTPAYSGAHHVYLSATSWSGWVSSGWQQQGEWTVPAHTLTVGAVSPINGQGIAQTFTVEFASSFGVADVQQGRLTLVADGAGFDQACQVAVNFVEGAVYLLDDAATGWFRQPLGGGVLENSRCRVPASGVTPVELNATTRRVSIPIEFHPAFLGTKHVFALLDDARWTNSAWQYRGEWTVPAHTLTADAILPASGTGRQQTFEVRYSSTFGASDVYQAYLWIDTGPDWFNACVVMHEPGTGRLALLSDAADAWQFGALNSPGTLQNSRCTITLTGATAQSNGTQWTLHVPVTFASGFAGTQEMRVIATTEGWATHSEWQSLGTWTVPARTITSGPVTPPSGQGLSTTLTAHFGSTDGTADVVQAVVVVAPTLSGFHACYVMLEPGWPRLGLLNDTATDWSWGLIGSGAPLHNSQCTVNPATATLDRSPDGTTWIVTVPVVFASGLTGTQHVYAAAADGDWHWHDWVETGTWTVPGAPAPHITQVSPTWGPVGTSVTVTGQHFGPPGSGSLSLHGTPLAIPSAQWTDEAITFVVPPGATTGAVVVTHEGPSNPVPFEVGDEGVEYYHTDAIGSVRMVTGYGGYVHERHDYLPFGAEWPPRPDQAHIGFGGTEKDQETGNGSWMALNYFGARHLHTASGRFTSVDPLLDIGRGILHPQRWNGYTYVENNPFRYVDPDGRDLCDIVVCDFINGMANAFGSNLFLGTGRLKGNSEFEDGQFVGDLFSIPWGASEFGFGLGLAGAGGAGTLITAGVATPIAVPVAVGGAAVTAHGLTTAGLGTAHAANYLAKKIAGGGGDKSFWQSQKPFRGKTRTNGESGKGRRYCGKIARTETLKYTIPREGTWAQQMRKREQSRNHLSQVEE